MSEEATKSTSSVGNTAGDVRSTDNDSPRVSTRDAAASGAKLRPRWSLLTLMLAAAVVCVWSLYFRFRYQNPRLLLSIESMRRLSNELVVEAPDRVAVIRKPRGWYDEAKWEVIIPETTRYRLRLATREIPRLAFDRVAAVKEAPMSPGRKQVELTTERASDGFQISVLVDDQVVMDWKEPSDWDTGHGSSGGAKHKRSYQPPAADSPVVLFHRRFMEESSKDHFIKRDGPGPGVKLWLEAETITNTEDADEED